MVPGESPPAPRPSSYLPPCGLSSPLFPIPQFLLTLWVGLRGGGKGADTKNSRCHPSSLFRLGPQLLLAYSPSPSSAQLPRFVWLCPLPHSIACLISNCNAWSSERYTWKATNSSTVRTPLPPLPFLVLHSEDQSCVNKVKGLVYSHSGHLQLPVT